MSAPRFGTLSVAAVSLAIWNLGACSSGGPQTTGSAGANGAAGTTGGSGTTGTATAGTSGGPAGTNGQAGATANVGTAGSGPGTGGAAAGTTGAAGASAGTTGAAGASAAGTGGGGTTGGAAGTSAGAGGTLGNDPGDTPPWRALNITATVAAHIHGNLSAGIDTRAPKILGKLHVDIGVNSGGYSSWLGKRGYHSMGAPCGACAAPNLGGGRDGVGNCRLNTEFANTATAVKSKLMTLQAQFPEEDWGYFLNQDGSVRWSDVAISGVSHGATTAAVAGRLGVRLWRVLSDAGPRDNTCGNGGGVCSVPFDPAHPPYDPNCPDSKIASWIDAPSKTPINRFYALVGTTDVECGDIMFNMFRAGYVGMPVQWDVPNPVLTGTNKFYSSTGGHLDFLGAADSVKPLNTDKVLNVVFAIPPENQNPAF